MFVRGWTRVSAICKSLLLLFKLFSSGNGYISAYMYTVASGSDRNCVNFLFYDVVQHCRFWVFVVAKTSFVEVSRFSSAPGKKCLLRLHPENLGSDSGSEKKLVNKILDSALKDFVTKHLINLNCNKKLQ